jgi:hypothetical protein
MAKKRIFRRVKGGDEDGAFVHHFPWIKTYVREAFTK